MKLSGLAGEFPDLGHPLFQLIVRVEIIESLLDSGPFLLPDCSISTMETDDSDIGSSFDYGRN